MKMVVMTFRSVDAPELVQALTEGGGYAAIVDPKPTLDSHLRAAEHVLLKLGYRRRDYVLIDGTAPNDREWHFTFVAPDEFTKPETR